MPDEKIIRFLAGVNQGLEVAYRRLQAEQEYLTRMEAHVQRLREAIAQLAAGPDSPT